uniref:Uncharacterized protein n=1 Tax=Fagus sylvatica TaxID=28930 RepID=A0A2N9GBR4_FAGSY
MGSTPPRIHGYGATVTPSTVRSARAHRARSDVREHGEGQRAKHGSTGATANCVV